jgi:hypothetical protein
MPQYTPMLEYGGGSDVIKSIFVAVAIVAASPAFSQIGSVQGISSATVTTAVAGAPLNGHKVQENLNFLCLGDYPFINVVKCTTTMTYGDNSAFVSPLSLDANGYPNNNTDLSVHSGYTLNTTWTPQSERPGNWVAAVTGNGVVQVPGTIITSNCGIQGSFQCTITSGSARVVFSPANASQISGNGAIRVISVGSPYITNIAMYHLDDEAAYNAALIAGEPWGGFTQKFTSMLRQNAGVIRFLNWENSNSNIIATWGQRTPVGYIGYGIDQYQASLFLGATTNSGDDYSITCPSTSYCFNGAGPIDKQTIQLYFNANATSTPAGVTICGTTSPPLIGTPCGTLSSTAAVVNWPSHGLTSGAPIGLNNCGQWLPLPLYAAQTLYVGTVIDANNFTVSAVSGGSAIALAATGNHVSPGGGCGGQALRVATLNLNISGAIQVRDSSGSPLTFGNVCELYSCGSAGTNYAYCTLIFNAGFNVWLSQGCGNGAPRAGITASVPPEVELALATQVGAHPYFVAHYLTLDPMSDYIPSLAAYLASNKPSWMVPRQEVPNELGNTLNQQTNYAANRATYYWNVSESFGDDWIGLIASTIGQAYNAAFGGPVDGTKYQVLVGTWYNPGNAQKPRLNSNLYVNQTATGLPQSGYTKSAASNWVNRVTYANYWGYSGEATALELYWATQYAQAGGNAILQETIANQMAGTASTSVSAVNASYVNTQAFAAAFTNSAGKTITMTGYEGGGNTNYGSGSGNYNFSGSIASASLATQGSFTLGQDSSSNYYNAVVGQSMSISGVTASGWTGLNGNTYVVQSVSGLGPYTVTLNVNTSGFGTTCTSGCGTATWASPTVNVTAIANSSPGMLDTPVTVTNVAGFWVGYQVAVSSVGGMSGWSVSGSNVAGPCSCNSYTVNSVDSGTNTLHLNVDSSGFGTYTSGGTVTEAGMQVLVDTLRWSTKQAPNTYTYYLQNLNNFKAAGGDFPAEFQFTGCYCTVGVYYNFPSSDPWSVYEDIYNPIVPMQWLAMQYFNTH